MANTNRTHAFATVTALLAYARIAVGVLILALIGVVAIQSGQIHKWHTQADKQAAARAADRATYEQAQRDAAERNRAEVAAKEAQSQRITDDTQSAYARDHAELVRLRQQALAAAKGSAGHTGASKDEPTAERADADGLHLSPDEHLQASEIELRLMHLQNWIDEQLKN